MDLSFINDSNFTALKRRGSDPRRFKGLKQTTPKGVIWFRKGYTYEEEENINAYGNVSSVT
jgi:hypothetical protein